MIIGSEYEVVQGYAGGEVAMIPEPSKNFYIIMGVILAAAIISIITMFRRT